MHMLRTNMVHMFGPKRKLNKDSQFSVSCNSHDITRSNKVKYLGLVIDNTLSGESIVQNIISKVNGKLKFLYRHNNCLDLTLEQYYVLRYYSVISTILVFLV